MKRLATLTALVAFAAAAQAAPETFVIDNSQTSSQFSYRALGLSNQTHRFEKISGRVVFDAAAKTGSADVMIDASSVNTGNALLNEHIQAADFFDTANHPGGVLRGRPGRLPRRALLCAFAHPEAARLRGVRLRPFGKPGGVLLPAAGPAPGRDGRRAVAEPRGRGKYWSVTL